MKTLRDSIDWIEKALCRYYDIKQEHSASSFLIGAEHLESLSRNSKESCVLVAKDSLDEAFVGVYFQPEIIEKIHQDNPFVGLTHKNLHAFWVLIEEISHFVLLTQRMKENRQTSALELEWQAEIDKILISSQLLTQQTEDPHYRPLIHASFDLSTIFSREKHYEEANHLAARFWFSAIRQGLGSFFNADHPKFLLSLRQNYKRSFFDKNFV